MNIKSMLIAVAATALTISSASAVDLTFSPHQIIGKMSCIDGKTVGTVGKTSCSLYQNKRLTKDQEQVMWSTLKKLNYPGKIIVSTKKDYDQAVGGWKKTGDCSVFKITNYSTNEAVNDAKYVYCQMHKKGYPVSKPKIIKNF